MTYLPTANSKQQTKILVTGAKGQLGYKIRLLLSSDYRLVLTDAQEMDITDKNQVKKVIGAEKPDFIIHGAAYTKVDQAEDESEICRKINAEGTKNIAEVCKETGVTLLYISTDFVFDGMISEQSAVSSQQNGYKENDQANPLSVYGKTKFEGEEHIRQICDKYYIIRVAWLFGELPEGHPGNNFVETMLRLAKDRPELNVVNDQIGSPTYTGDLVEAIKNIVGSQQQIVAANSSSKPQTVNRKVTPVPYGTYHFSGDGACSWFDFAKEIFELTATDIKVKPITSDQFPQKAKRPTYSYLDKNKIEKELKFNVRSWEEMLKEYLAKR